MQKPGGLLSVEAQVAYLAAKGVGFAQMNEAAAMEYLQYHNNYFKLTAYRKNYQKHPGGAKAGQYVRLEFAHLVDLATIDMEWRYQIMQMALDIEHHAKLQILRLLEAEDADAYDIVAAYRAALSENDRRILDDELQRNRGNVYCGALAEKYAQRLPVWVFLELVSFGKLLSFYRFVAETYHQRAMKNMFYCLLDCKTLRNAAAHNSCLLNDLSAGGARRVNADVAQALAAIEALPKTFRRQKLGCERLRQLVTLLYAHRAIVTSDSLHQREAERLQALSARMHAHDDYYSEQDLIRTSFAFLRVVIDNWYALR